MKYRSTDGSNARWVLSGYQFDIDGADWCDRGLERLNSTVFEQLFGGLTAADVKRVLDLQRWMAHRQVRDRGVSFAEYCRSAGLKAKVCHGVRHGVVKKKWLPPGPGARPKSVPLRRKPARFIPVRVESSPGAGSSHGMLCRVRHPSGCIIE